MEWGELKILYAQKRREALAFAQRERAIEHARERRTSKPVVGKWLMWFRRALAKRGRVT
jgi:hypothetical protein